MTRPTPAETGSKAGFAEGYGCAMRFIVTSREEIERGIVVKTPYVVVSISDPGTRRPRIPQGAGFRRALYLQFHDAEAVPGAESPAGILPMSVADAQRIWDFVLHHWDHIGTIVVHCEQGASRSPAVIAGIAGALGIDVEDVLRLTQPNQFVADLIRLAGEVAIEHRVACKLPIDSACRVAVAERGTGSHAGQGTR
jgi:predicted protein tyrosine phosphatase